MARRDATGGAVALLALWLPLSIAGHAVVVVLFAIASIPPRPGGGGTPEVGDLVEISLDGFSAGSTSPGEAPPAGLFESEARAEAGEPEDAVEALEAVEEAAIVIDPGVAETPIPDETDETEPREPEPEVDTSPEPRPAIVARPRPATGTEASGESASEAEEASEASVASAMGRGDPSSEGDEDARGDGSEREGEGGDVGRLILGGAGRLGSAGVREALGANAGTCSDPVAGVWRAQKYRASDRSWIRFTLRVRNQGGGELRGTIESRIWTGRPGTPTPGNCTAFGFDHTWRMPARGRVDGEQMSFGARSVRLVRQDCPQSGHIYYPDRFRGSLRLETFEALNNDGAMDRDEPYTFRRVACE